MRRRDNYEQPSCEIFSWLKGLGLKVLGCSAKRPRVYGERGLSGFGLKEKKRLGFRAQARFVGLQDLGFKVV